MWIIYKQVGLFTHYLDSSGSFQPVLEKARKFPSEQMAEIMAKQHGGLIRKVN
ncbi:MAG: hypothetical protein Kow0049_23670 [Stanieria sp.]